MKRITVLFLTAALCIYLTACTGEPESVDSPQESQPVQTEEEPVQQNIELIGPWHLDSEKNDLNAFADSLELFPGYGEWGASMEIRSRGLVWNLYDGGCGDSCTADFRCRAIDAALGFPHYSRRRNSDAGNGL